MQITTARLRNLLILTLVSLLVMAPLFPAGFPVTHDGYHHLVRIAHLVSLVRQGHIMPTWAGSLNGGLGSPIFLYNWLLPYYAALPLVLSGMSIVNAFKLSIILLFMLSAIGFYLFMCRHAKPASALLASLLFLLAPYQLYNIYVRGAVGEIFSWSLAPWALYTASRLRAKPGLANSLLLAIVGSLLIVSHYQTAFIIFPVLLGYSLATSGQQPLRAAVRVSAALAVSALITAFNWFPMLAELPFIGLYGESQSSFRDHFLNLHDFGTPQALLQWMVPLTSPVLEKIQPLLLAMARALYFTTGLALMLGVCQLLVPALVLIRLKSAGKPHDKQRSFVTFFLLVFSISLFLTLSYSSFLWTHVPLLSSVLFPFRFLGISTIASVALAGRLLDEHRRPSLLALLLLILSLAIVPRYLPSTDSLMQFTDGRLYADRSDTDPTAVFFPRWASPQEKGEEEHKTIIAAVRGASEAQPLPLETSETRIRFRINPEEDATLTLNTLFFPGWKAYINRRPVPVEPGGQGRIQLAVPAGESEIELDFGKTDLRRTAGKVSGLTVALLAAVSTLVWLRRAKGKLHLCKPPELKSDRRIEAPRVNNPRLPAAGVNEGDSRRRMLTGSEHARCVSVFRNIGTAGTGAIAH